jgi:endonuclease G
LQAAVLLPCFLRLPLMKKSTSSSRSRAFRFPGTHALLRRSSALLALLTGLSLHSCAPVPAQREVAAAAVRLETLAQGLGTAVREHAGAVLQAPGAALGASRGQAPSSASSSTDDFAACPQFFAGGRPPVVASRPTHRALCYDAFAILHSGESKTAVYVAQKLNRSSVLDADEKRTNRFYADARLRSAERATLEDYKGSGFDRGHLAPAGQMPTLAAMAQSFSLANMVPQAPEHNQGTWRVSVEDATKKYAGRAAGDVYVITGPVFVPSIAQSPAIGPGQVHVPAYLFKLVYDERQGRAWAHWHVNDNATRGSRPISYAELVRRTGVEFLPGVRLAD